MILWSDEPVFAFNYKLTLFPEFKEFSKLFTFVGIEIKAFGGRSWESELEELWFSISKNY